MLEFRDIAPEVRHFAFEAEGVERLDYEPGQFISISEAAGGKPITRAYSICSAPMGRQFELCLNRVANGNLTPRLFELRPGDRVAFSGPTGHFVLRQPISDSVLVATGTGIAPFRAMLQDCRVWASDREFTLIFGARYEHGLLYREEFEELARRLQYLDWQDRAKLLDEYLWIEARTRLSTDGVTAVVNRHPEIFRRGHPAVAYATWCTAIVASVLQLLGEDGRADCAEHALTLLLSRWPAHQDSADAWLERATPEDLQRELAKLPGYAFLLLTLSPNDSAESFIARDAFWTAMLG